MSVIIFGGISHVKLGNIPLQCKALPMVSRVGLRPKFGPILHEKLTSQLTRFLYHIRNDMNLGLADHGFERTGGLHFDKHHPI